LERSRQVEFDLFEAAINVLTLKQADTSILELFREVKNSPRFRGLPWRGVPWRGVAWPCCATLFRYDSVCILLAALVGSLNVWELLTRPSKDSEKKTQGDGWQMIRE
jgi:hypothetical protein